MTERVNMTMSDDLRARMEQWRAAQFDSTGRIPSLIDTARVLIHKGLVFEGFDTRGKVDGK